MWKLQNLLKGQKEAAAFWLGNYNMYYYSGV